MINSINNEEYIKPYEKLVQETINSFDYIFQNFKFESIENNKELVGIPTTAFASLVPYTNVGRIVLIYEYCDNDPSCDKVEKPEYLSKMTFKKPFVSELLDEHGITVTHKYSGGYSVHNGHFYHTYRYEIEFDASSIIEKLINTYNQMSNLYNNKEYIKPYEKLVQETINSFDYIFQNFKFESIENNKELVGIPTTAFASLVPYTNVGRIVLIYRYCDNDPSYEKCEKPEYLSEMTFKKPFVSELLDEHGITVTHEYSGGYSVHNGNFYHTYRYDIEFDASSIIDKLNNTYDQMSKRLR